MNAIRVTKAKFPRNERRPKIRREAREHFLARRSLRQFQFQLNVLSTNEWPPRLFAAWKILCRDFGLADSTARPIVIASISAAHGTVTGQSKQLRNLTIAENRTKIEHACRRIANCIRRAPAGVRRHLDQAIAAIVEEPAIDAEIIELIFKATAIVFKKYSMTEASQAAKKQLLKIAIAHYEVLDFTSRGEVEDSITKLLVKSGRQIKGVEVFAAMAAALADIKNHTKKTKYIRTLITRYVATVADLWRHAGLKPSRAIAYLDETYRSKFHAFTELVLTELAAPSALQHSLRNLPNDPEPLNALRSADYQWLVSDDHVRRALYSKKTTQLHVVETGTHAN